MRGAGGLPGLHPKPLSCRLAPHLLRLPIGHGVDTQREGRRQRGPVRGWSHGLAAACTGTAALPHATRAQPPDPCAHAHEGCSEGLGEPPRSLHPRPAEASAPSSHPPGRRGEGARGRAVLWSRHPGAWQGRCRGNGWDAFHGGCQSPGRPPALRPARTGSEDTQDRSESANAKPSSPCVRQPEAVGVLAIGG